MNKEQFSAQVLAIEKSLYYTAKSIVKQDEDCADVLQNAILIAYSKLHALRNENYFKTWITRILINECYAFIKKRRNYISYEDYVEHAGQMESIREEAILVESEVFDAIDNLPKIYKLPFSLYYISGYSVNEIARILKCTEGSVKTRLYRARNILKNELKGVNGYGREVE